MTTTSVANIVREVNKVMMDGDQRSTEYPDTREAIASELFSMKTEIPMVSFGL